MILKSEIAASRVGQHSFAMEWAVGWQIPGGHVEVGEAVMEAAVREVKEEAGATLNNLSQLGYIKMEVLGSKPENYTYPYPIRYGQVMATRLNQMQPFQPFTDAIDRGLFKIEQLDELDGDWGPELLFIPYGKERISGNTQQLWLVSEF